MRWGALVAVVVTAGLGAVSCTPARAEGPTVRFATTLGSIDVLLLSDEAPKTVANFLGYVDRGDYNGTFFHRSVSGFVVQGGGFTFAGGQPVQIPAQPPVVNEFKVSNTRGTLAMAKLGGDPNSATDQWFFNESDANAANLDAQNGGFTVFGRIVNSSGLDVMDTIAGQRVVDASATFGSTFNQLPTVDYPTGTTPGASNLVTVTSITRLTTGTQGGGTDTTAPTIVSRTPRGNQHFTLGAAVSSDYSCDDGAGSGVASCTAPATVDTSVLGAHKFTIAASDNAGNNATQTVTYYVDPAPPPSPPATTTTTTDTPVTTPPPATPTPPAPVAAAPVLAGAVRTSATGVVTMTLRCGAAERCSGRVRLVATTRAGSSKRPRTVTVGARAYVVAPGDASRLVVRLSTAGRRLLAHGHGRLTVAVTLTPDGAAGVQRRLTLTTHR